MLRTISPTYDPGMIQDEHPGALKGLAVVQKIMRDLRNLEEALAADPTLTAQAKLAKLGSFAERRTKTGTEALDQAHLDLRLDIRAAETEIRQTMKPPPLGLAGEFRTRLAGMNDKERSEVMEQALKAGPEGEGGQIFGAALSTPSFLTGLTPAEANLLRLRWTQLHASDQMNRIASLNKNLGHIERAGTAFLGEIQETAAKAGGAMKAAGRTRVALEV